MGLPPESIEKGPQYYVPYHYLVGGICGGKLFRIGRQDGRLASRGIELTPCEEESMWQAGYCGRSCCHEDRCLTAFVGKEKKGTMKCITCYVYANLDPCFDAMSSDDDDSRERMHDRRQRYNRSRHSREH